MRHSTFNVCQRPFSVAVIMIDYVETFHYYVLLLKASEQDTTHNLIAWYQNRFRFYGDENG